MKVGKTLILVFMILFAMFLFGCKNMDMLEMLKANSQIKEFLQEYPNADMTMIKISAKNIASENPKVKELCGIELEEKTHYLITINDADSNIDIYAYIDSEAQEIICIKKVGKQVDEQVKEQISVEIEQTENTESQNTVESQQQTEQIESAQTTEQVAPVVIVAKKENENLPRCLVNPTGYMPNPNNYPDYYDPNGKMHYAKILHRVTKDCKTNKTIEIPDDHVDNRPGFKIDFAKDEQIVDLEIFQNGEYCNVVCRSRWYEQCILDGSYDSWYDEWCEYKELNIEKETEEVKTEKKDTTNEQTELCNEEIELESLIQNGKVILEWNKASCKGFNGYKVVWSDSVENPKYPENGYITYITDINKTVFEETQREKNGHYAITVLYGAGKHYSNSITVQAKVEQTEDDSNENETESDDDSLETKTEYVPVLIHEIVNGTIVLKWNAYEGTDLSYYKVVWSKTNTDPKYPEDGYIAVISDKSQTTFTVPSEKYTIGTNYYRISTILDGFYSGNDEKRINSNVIVLEK